ncbi:unnamed protein product, partial [marine sediment metagenome]
KIDKNFNSISKYTISTLVNKKIECISISPTLISLFKFFVLLNPFFNLPRLILYI